MPDDLLEEFIRERGNIDVTRRPPVMTPEGLPGTVRSMSVNIDGVEVLIPTISDDGRVMSEQEAIAEYNRTGRHLGKFSTPEEATAFGKRLSGQEAERLRGR